MRNLGSCAYYRGEGTCSFGCYSEPECQTCEPDGGWPPAKSQRLEMFARKAWLLRYPTAASVPPEGGKR